MNIRIIRPKMDRAQSGKIEFTQEAQMHLDVIESTANVEHIVKEVQQRWGEEYVIVTLDGLELENCEGTQGENTVCTHTLISSSHAHLQQSLTTFV